MRRQSGVATVEFAAIAVAFVLVVFGAIEVSRLLFTWNALGAIAQRGARVAAVCPPDAASIARVAAFRDADGAGGLLPDFVDGNLEITYLDDDLSDTGGDFPIRFVRARIVDYRHRLAIPFVDDPRVSAPAFSTTVPAESLGYVPATGERTCVAA